MLCWMDVVFGFIAFVLITQQDESEQVSHPSGPKGVDCMVVLLFFTPTDKYSQLPKQDAWKKKCEKKKGGGSCRKSYIFGTLIKQLFCEPCRRYSVYCELERDPIEEKLCCPFHLPEHC